MFGKPNTLTQTLQRMLRFLLIFSLLTIFPSFGKSQDVKVMTYNIRFDNPNDGENAWPNRKDFLVTQIQYTSPLVFGVQEALKHQLDYISQEMQDFDYFGVGRDDGKDAGEFSAIFYNKAKLKLKDSGTFWLSPSPDIPSKGWDAALNRICTYGLFKPKKGKPFWVFNTHFDHAGKEARVESTRLILSQIQKLNTKGYAVILMGDLNLPPESEPIQLLAQAMKDTFTAGQRPSLGPNGSFTGFSWEKPVGNRIDYIFVSKDVKVVQTAILTDSKNHRYPSDHFPVVAILKTGD